MLSYEEATERCWAQIDLDALRLNYERARRMLQSGALLIPVLKANAYGLGAREVARTLYPMGASLFAVATVSEAEEIKDDLPGADVLVMGLCGVRQARRAIERGVLLTVFSFAQAEGIAQAAREAQRAARVHLKLDTGLHRLGFSRGENLDPLFERAEMKIEGIYTHLALRGPAEDREQLEALYEQAERYPALLAHALDSIGMVRYPEDHMGGVRTGAWLYGVCPRGYAHPEQCLQPMSLKARVAQVHFVPAGRCIGYDDEHPLARDSLVATLAAGYVDGYTRFNNVGEVILRGERAPVLGLVCMDQMMVDVTDIPGAAEGDVATLIGGSIGVDEYAAWGGLNRNEALARVGRRVPRVYVSGGEVVAIRDYMGAAYE